MKLTATINHNMHSDPSDPGYKQRVKLILRRDADRMLRWYTEAGEDTEVAAKTIIEARRACRRSWAGPGWDLRATWL